MDMIAVYVAGGVALFAIVFGFIAGFAEDKHDKKYLIQRDKYWKFDHKNQIEKYNNAIKDGDVKKAYKLLKEHRKYCKLEGHRLQCPDCTRCTMFNHGVDPVEADLNNIKE